MKRGPEYLHSTEKRAVDLIIGSLLVPAVFGATTAAELTFTRGGELYFNQLRTGQKGQNFIIKKIRTLDDNGQPLSKLAESYRAKGLDELPQLELIRQGVMSIFGSRPLIPEDLDSIYHQASKTNYGRNLVAEHQDIVLPAKRGIISRFGLSSHIHVLENNVITRLEMDIKDHRNASLVYDMQTLIYGIKAVAGNELMRHSSTVGNP